MYVCMLISIITFRFDAYNRLTEKRLFNLFIINFKIEKSNVLGEKTVNSNKLKCKNEIKIYKKKK